MEAVADLSTRRRFFMLARQMLRVLVSARDAADQNAPARLFHLLCWLLLPLTTAANAAKLSGKPLISLVGAP
jgi:hypothetical protein